MTNKEIHKATLGYLTLINDLYNGNDAEKTIANNFLRLLDKIMNGKFDLNKEQ